MHTSNAGVDSEILYLLLIVVALPLLLLLVTGPGMWSERWGWRTLERLEQRWHRLVGRKQER